MTEVKETGDRTPKRLDQRYFTKLPLAPNRGKKKRKGQKKGAIFLGVKLTFLICVKEWAPRQRTQT